MSYRNIVVAIDLSDECSQLMACAMDLAIAHGARLLPIHVVELTDMAFGSEAALDLPKFKQELLDKAQRSLAAFAAQLPGLAIEASRLVCGDPRHEIHRAALELNADLILVGSHGRHGLALLLGSTANGMLHSAPCDVLAVRLGKRGG